MSSNLKNAMGDIFESRKYARLIHILGWQDMRHRYKRSLLGPFWFTASTAALIASICLVMGPALGASAVQYIPFVSSGVIIWSLITSMCIESCATFISDSTMIRQTSAPLFTYVARVAWKNTLVFAHNIVVFPLALWIAGAGTNLNVLLSVPGFLLVIMNLTWMGFILAILAARYRDLQKTIESVMPVIMFLTPVWWMPNTNANEFIIKSLQLNPFFWMLDLVRTPLMGGVPTGEVWLGAAMVAVAGWITASIVFARTKDRIVYWL